MLKQTEHQIQSVIIQYLKYKQYKVWRSNSGKSIYEHKGVKRMVTYGERGIPDVMAIQPKTGKLVCIECKSKTGKLSEHQKMWLDDAEAHGAIVIVARGIDDLKILDK